MEVDTLLSKNNTLSWIDNFQNNKNLWDIGK